MCNRLDTVGVIGSKVPISAVAAPQPTAAPKGCVCRGAETVMASRASADANRHRGVSISFDPTELKWVDELVGTLEREGYALAGRSEVIRIGLIELREALGEMTPSELVMYFARRHADRVVASAARTASSPSTARESDTDN